MRRLPPEPPVVRVEPPAPEPPPPAGLGTRARVAAAGAAGLAFGFLLAVSLGSGDGPEAPEEQPIATSVDATAPAAAVDLASGGSLPAELLVVTDAPDTGLAVHLVTATGSDLVARLPDGLLTTTLSWDSARRAIGGLGPGPAGTALYAGQPEAMVPVTLEAASFAWHDRRAGHLAWTAAGPDSDVLFTGNVVFPGTAPQAIGPVSGPVVAWGDWGYLIQSTSELRPVELVQPGGVVAEPGSIATTNTNYRTLPVFTEAAAPPAPTIVDVYAAAPVSLDIGADAYLVTVSPALRRAAWLVQTGSRSAELRVQGFDEAAPGVIAIPPAWLLDWSPDGRFFALRATSSRVDEGRVDRPLLVVDADAGTVHEAAQPPGLVVGAAVREAP